MTLLYLTHADAERIITHHAQCGAVPLLLFFLQAHDLVFDNAEIKRGPLLLTLGNPAIGPRLRMTRHIAKHVAYDRQPVFFNRPNAT